MEQPLIEQPTTDGQPCPQPESPPDLGWSWGAFFLTWTWMVGNRAWKGMWTLVVFVAAIVVVFVGHLFPYLWRLPLIYLVVAAIFGWYGNRWAWCSGRCWESPAHFAKVQKRWGAIGLVLFLGFNIVCMVLVWQAISSFASEELIADRNGKAFSTLKSLKSCFEYYYIESQEYPRSFDKLDPICKVPPDVLVDCRLSKANYDCTAAHRQGTRQYFVSRTSGDIAREAYTEGDPVRVERFLLR